MLKLSEDPSVGTRLGALLFLGFCILSGYVEFTKMNDAGCYFLEQGAFGVGNLSPECETYKEKRWNELMHDERMLFGRL